MVSSWWSLHGRPPRAVGRAPMTCQLAAAAGEMPEDTAMGALPAAGAEAAGVVAAKAGAGTADAAGPGAGPPAALRVSAPVLALAGFFCLGIGISGQHWCFSVFVLPVERDFGWSRSEINGAYSIGMVAGGICAPLWGKLLDQRGARLTLSASQAIVGAGWLLRSQADSLLVFYASFAVVFMGLPGTVLSVPKALATAFPENKGTVVGFATTGVSIMSMVLVPAAEAVISSKGWRTACLMFAATNLIAVLIAVSAFSGNAAKPAATAAAAAGAEKEPSIFNSTFVIFAIACNIGQLSYAAVGAISYFKR